MSPIATAAKHAFRLVSKIRCNGVIDVFKYRSERTGLRVTIADAKGPNVNGYFSLATETDSDDGLPHTLEHLVFTGSTKYPYKGLLDLVANRCLASGTNAWTDTDNTSYTLSTAGSEGFLIMLPIYLDHLFFPLLTDAQYMTEVHHVTGEGKDGGVVYCEMEDWESKMDAMVELLYSQSMYPDENCGYRYQTGGRLPNLRTTCSNEKVKQFHKDFYIPRNCEVIIVGVIDHEKVFASLKELEEKMIETGLAKQQQQKQQRPWSTPVAELKIPEVEGVAVKELTVKCPSDDGKTGTVTIGWRGPSIKNYEEIVALDSLLDYLTDSAVSPLEQALIQIPDPFCASICARVQEYSATNVKIDFTGVKFEKLKMIRQRMIEIIERIATGTVEFDLKRMHDLLHRSRLKVENKMENNTDQKISEYAIGDFIYGDGESDSKLRFDRVATYKRLREQPAAYWVKLLSTYLNPKRPHICIIGEPSTQLVQELSEAEKKRIAAQIERLGEKGLEKCEETLTAAMEEIEKNEPPEELLEQLIVDSLDGIRYFDVGLTSNLSSKIAEDNKKPCVDLSKLPLSAIVADCNGTDFVDFALRLNTDLVDGSEQKVLLFLWSAMLFESAINRDGKGVLPYETVVTELNRDLVSYSSEVGVSGSFYRWMSLNLKVDMERFKNVIQWAKDVLFETQFDAERIRVIAQRMINLSAEYKRDGYTVAKFLSNYLIYEPNSPPLIQNVIFQEKFLTKMLIELEKDPKKVINQLESVRAKLSNPSGIIVTASCEASKFKQHNINPCQLLAENLIPQRFKVAEARPRATIELPEPTYVKPADRFGSGVIASVGSSESSFVIQTMPCPMAYDHEDLPALFVLLQYLGQCEGPLWKEIRGRGLAYGANIDLTVDKGLLTFLLYRTTDPIAAFTESREVIATHCKDGEEYDEDQFEAAKRSLIFELIEAESTVKLACMQAILTKFRGVEKDYNRKLLHRVWDVEMDQLPKIGAKYLSGLFDNKRANTAVTCHPSKLDELVKGFKDEFERDLKVCTLEDPELYKY